MGPPGSHFDFVLNCRPDVAAWAERREAEGGQGQVRQPAGAAAVEDGSEADGSVAVVCSVVGPRC